MSTGSGKRSRHRSWTLSYSHMTLVDLATNQLNARAAAHFCGLLPMGQQQASVTVAMAVCRTSAVAGKLMWGNQLWTGGSGLWWQPYTPGPFLHSQPSHRSRSWNIPIWHAASCVRRDGPGHMFSMLKIPGAVSGIFDSALPHSKLYQEFWQVYQESQWTILP